MMHKKPYCGNVVLHNLFASLGITGGLICAFVFNVIPCKAADQSRLIDSAGKAFIDRNYAQAQKQYLLLANDAATPQAQRFKTRAAYCLLFDGKDKEAVQLLQEISEQYSDVFSPEAVNAVERLEDFEKMPQKVQKRILHAELIRLGLVTEDDIKILQPFLKVEETDPPSAWFPLWQEVSANVVSFIKHNEKERAEQIIQDSMNFLPQEEGKKLVLDVVSEYCFYVQTSSVVSQDDFDECQSFFKKYWGEAQKRPAIIAHAHLNARASLLHGVIAYAKASSMISSDSVQQIYQNASEIFEKSLSMEDLKPMLRLGALFRLMTLRNPTLSPENIKLNCTDIAEQFPDSALLALAFTQSAIILKNKGASDYADDCANYVKQKFPNSQEAKFLSSEEFSLSYGVINTSGSQRRLLIITVNVVFIIALIALWFRKRYIRLQADG